MPLFLSSQKRRKTLGTSGHPCGQHTDCFSRSALPQEPPNRSAGRGGPRQEAQQSPLQYRLGAPRALPPRLQPAGCPRPSHHFLQGGGCLPPGIQLKTFVKNHFFHLRNNKLSRFPASDFFCTTSLLPSGLSEALLILITAFSLCLFKNQKADRLFEGLSVLIVPAYLPSVPLVSKGNHCHPHWCCDLCTRTPVHATLPDALIRGGNTLLPLRLPCWHFSIQPLLCSIDMRRI